jgi:hypothetical protein
MVAQLDYYKPQTTNSVTGHTPLPLITFLRAVLILPSNFVPSLPRRYKILYQLFVSISNYMLIPPYAPRFQYPNNITCSVGTRLLMRRPAVSIYLFVLMSKYFSMYKIFRTCNLFIHFVTTGENIFLELNFIVMESKFVDS